MVSLPQAGLNYKLTKTFDEADIQTTAIDISLRTPFTYLSRIDFRGNIELEDFVYRGNASIETADTNLSVVGSYQVRNKLRPISVRFLHFYLHPQDDKEYLDTSLYMHLSAPAVPKYACRIFVKKDFSSTEKLLDLGYELMENETQSHVSKLRSDSHHKQN